MKRRFTPTSTFASFCDTYLRVSRYLAPRIRLFLGSSTPGKIRVKQKLVWGFTLIELMVSVAIFTVVMTVALGALLAVTESDRKGQTIETLTNNLGFALETMSRNIRTGINYDCNPNPSTLENCPTAGGTVIYFLPVCTSTSCPPPRQAYRHQTSAAECGQPAGAVGCIQRSTDAGGTWQTITAPEVVIQSLRFYLVGAPRGDSLQPRVTIAITGYLQAGGQRSDLQMQTTVTQRLYDR